ncbi:hypothetical protein PVIIG_03111 [Plasmodium vivax India VII]|uniref:Uncharacterized protein n=1 Tax=Plasmodium vivax India VII TaxID=1077284 RepID=A0A0J9SCQ8_PLAVI|nr:hypothetical protein PVIIG_03111 [Plasmodium vivax India VII]
MARPPLDTGREREVSSVCALLYPLVYPFVCRLVCQFTLLHLVSPPFAFPEGNLFLGLRKRRRSSRTHTSSCSESVDSSHADSEDEDNNYYGTSLYDSDFDIEDSETENNSTTKSNLSSPSTEEPPDSPYKTGFLLQATLPPLEEGQFHRADEQDSDENLSGQGPTEDNTDAALLRGSIQTNPFVTPPSSPPKDEPPVFLRRKDNTRRSQLKTDTLKRWSLLFLRGVSPFRHSMHGTSNSHGNHHNGCGGPSADANVGEGTSHEEASPKKEPKMEDWEKYKAGGIFDMTEEDIKAFVTLPRKAKSLETMLEAGMSLEDENGEANRGEEEGGEADGEDEAEDENDNSVKGIYLSCLEDLTSDTQTSVVGGRKNEGKAVEEASDYVRIYSGDHASEKKPELTRLKELLAKYEQKKEEIKQKRLRRKRSACRFNNDCESHADISNEENYTNMKDTTMEVNNLLDNVSLVSLPIEFIDQ